MSQSAIDQVIGKRGCKVVATSTSPVTLNHYALLIRASLVVTSIKIDDKEKLTAMGLSGVTLEPGELLTCSGDKFTEITTAAAGSIMGYNS